MRNLGSGSIFSTILGVKSASGKLDNVSSKLLSRHERILFFALKSRFDLAARFIDSIDCYSSLILSRFTSEPRQRIDYTERNQTNCQTRFGNRTARIVTEIELSKRDDRIVLILHGNESTSAKQDI